jgi:hypothetical protein
VRGAGGRGGGLAGARAVARLGAHMPAPGARARPAASRRRPTARSRPKQRPKQRTISYEVTTTSNLPGCSSVSFWCCCGAGGIGAEVGVAPSVPGRARQRAHATAGDACSLQPEQRRGRQQLRTAAAAAPPQTLAAAPCAAMHHGCCSSCRLGGSPARRPTRSSPLPWKRTALMVGAHRLNSFIQLCSVDLGTITMWGPLMPRNSLR